MCGRGEAPIHKVGSGPSKDKTTERVTVCSGTEMTIVLRRPSRRVDASLANVVFAKKALSG